MNYPHEKDLRGFIKRTQEFIEWTYDIERSFRRIRLAEIGLFFFSLFGVGLAIGTGQWYLTPIWGIVLFTTYKGSKRTNRNLEIIQDNRKGHQLDSLHFQAALMEYRNTGQLADWMFDYPTKNKPMRLL